MTIPLRKEPLSMPMSSIVLGTATCLAFVVLVGVAIRKR
jgi:hypothetical protein